MKAKFYLVIAVLTMILALNSCENHQIEKSRQLRLIKLSIRTKVVSN